MKKTALITGGCSGIGYAVVKKFTVERWRTVVFDKAPFPEGLMEKDCVYCQTDLENEKEIKDAFARMAETVQSLEAVVNCAGDIENLASIDDLEKEAFEKVLRINLTGVFLVCKHALPYLRRASESSIVNIGSISGIRKASDYAAYSASKSGLFGLTLSMAKQLAGAGIRVNMVSPGSVIETGFWAKQYGKEPSLIEKAQLMKQSLLKKLNTPEAIAEAVYFLSSKGAQQITGENIIVDGGSTLC